MNIYLFAASNITWWKFILTAVGGFLGGALVVTSGGGSFVTYPLLLAMGQSSIAANATSSVGLYAGWGVSAPQFRHETKLQWPIIRVLLIPAFLGAILGSFVLTKTPADVFGIVAPVLIFCASLALQFRNGVIRFGEKLRIRTHKRRLATLIFLTFFVCCYSSFFGAGVGILMLACLSLMNVEHLVHNIAIKNALIIVANGVGVIYFLWVGIANIPYALALACGSVPGGLYASRLVRRVSEKNIRVFTVAFGCVASIALLIFQLTR